MSGTALPPGEGEAIISSSCDSRRLPVGTRRGVNVPLPSPGMRNTPSPPHPPPPLPHSPLPHSARRPPPAPALKHLREAPAAPVELHLARVDLREQIIQHPGLDQTLSALRLNLAPLITRRLVD